jgi:hypothetical protein
LTNVKCDMGRVRSGVDVMLASENHTDTRADKEPGMIGVQVAAGQHVLHHVLGDPCRRLALIKFCAGHMTGGDHDFRWRICDAPRVQCGQELGIDIGRVGISGRSCQQRDHQYNAGRR